MVDPELIAGAVGLIFGAGVAWGLMRGQVSRTRNDVNGIGKKLAEHIRQQDLEFDRVKLAMQLIVPEEKREELIARFWPE